MSYVLTFAAGVALTLFVMASSARRMLVVVLLIGALFGGAVIYGGSTGVAAPAPSGQP